MSRWLFPVVVALCLELRVTSGYSCGADELPVNVTIGLDGMISMSCEAPNCTLGIGTHTKDRSKDLKRKCQSHLTTGNCFGKNRFVAGISDMSNVRTVLGVKCCTSPRVLLTGRLGHKLITTGETFHAGNRLKHEQGRQVHGRGGRQVGYHVITNIVKSVRRGPRGGRVSYRVSYRSMDCLPHKDKTETDPDNPENPDNPNNQDSKYENLVDEDVGLQEDIFKHLLIEEGVPPPPPAPIPLPIPAVVVGAPCFSGTTTVKLESGETKTMKELHVGDKVASVERNAIIYRPVTSFLHFVPDRDALFYEVKTTSAKELKLTAKHFIYTVDCQMNVLTASWHLTPAEHLRKGDCLIDVSVDTGVISTTKIASITTLREVGYYSPLTTDSLIVVDGLLASCLSVVPDERLLQTSLNFASSLQRVLSWLTFSWVPTQDAPDPSGRVELPYAVEFAFRLMDNVLPSRLI